MRESYSSMFKGDLWSSVSLRISSRRQFSANFPPRTSTSKHFYRGTLHSTPRREKQFACGVRTFEETNFTVNQPWGSRFFRATCSRRMKHVDVSRCRQEIIFSLVEWECTKDRSREIPRVRYQDTYSRRKRRSDFFAWKEASQLGSARIAAPPPPIVTDFEVAGLNRKDACVL